MAFLGREAVVKKGSTEIGYCKGVRVSANADLIKDYILGQATPAVLESGNQSFPISVDKMYIDSDYGQALIDGTKIQFSINPEGTATGAEKLIELKNVVLSSWELTIVQDGLVLEAVGGEGDSLDWTTAS